MTTERARHPAPRPTRATPAIALSAREWRLWLITALASGYALVWLALAPDERRATEPVSNAPVPKGPRPEVAWIDDLPREQRPTVVLPAGWTLDAPGWVPDTRPRPAAAELVRQAPRLVRQPHGRRARVRTRSS